MPLAPDVAQKGIEPWGRAVISSLMQRTVQICRPAWPFPQRSWSR